MDASVSVGDEEHGILNRTGSTHCAVGGRGLRVQGARTVSSDTDWRFVNVRRLISMIEKALESALQWAVFEPNGVFTRARATMSVTIFLLGLHERGMLAGATPGGVVRRQVRPRQQPGRGARPRSPRSSRSSVAPSKPFEFVVLRVGRVRDALEVTDAADAFSISGLES